MTNTIRTASSYYSTSSYFSNALRKNGFRSDLAGYTLTEGGYAHPYINDGGSYSNYYESYIVHSTVKKMLSVLFSHFTPSELEQFYSFLKFGLQVIAETDIDEKQLYTFDLSVNENKSFTLRSDLFSFSINPEFSFRSLGISLEVLVLTELSYDCLMSAMIDKFKLSLRTIIEDSDAVINNHVIKKILGETRITHHLRKYGEHIKHIPYSNFIENSLNFFLNDLEHSKKIGFGINTKLGYIHSDYMVDLHNSENMKKTDYVNLLFNAKDFRSITPLLKNVMHEKDMKMMFAMFDMYLFKMHLQNNPNSHNHASFTKYNIENVSKSKTLDNNIDHFEFKFNHFVFKVSKSLFFTDFSGKGGYYTSKEDSFERMYIEYQKHIVKGISVILKEPAEDINYQTLLVHFMMTI